MTQGRSNRCLAVIPARGGSRRIPMKNIRRFAGRPMIEYAIELALGSRLFDRIVVSTDSPEIAEVSRRAGAEVPFFRPDHLADDDATTAAAFHHALEAVDAASRYEFACCLYPSSPFVAVVDLREGLSLVAEHRSGSALAVTTFGAPIWRAFERGEDGTLTMLWPENRDVRSQDLPEAVHDAGQFYWVPVAGFLAHPVLFTKTTRGVLMPRWRAHDIDTEEDWKRAELIFRALKSELQE